MGGATYLPISFCQDRQKTKRYYFLTLGCLTEKFFPAFSILFLNYKDLPKSC